MPHSPLSDKKVPVRTLTNNYGWRQKFSTLNLQGERPLACPRVTKPDQTE